MQHPQCRFVARYDWLSEALAFDPLLLPAQPCPRFQAWRDQLQASELTLVFPSAFINNPSSMFGHTLLRIDGTGQGERTRLLAYAINYAVSPGDDGQVSFIFKSLSGFYPGQFSIMPYYVKVKEYSDMESRDIWEYRLDFTQPEIDRLLMHAWELSTTHFDYYFFDENCAYHLLSLFEVARPELELSSRFRGWVIPIDTVRLIAAEPGMLKEAVYRPANDTRLRHRLSLLDRDEQALLRRLLAADGSAGILNGILNEISNGALPAAMDEQRQALLLETAFTLLRRETHRGRYPQQASAQLSRELLVARSRLPALIDPVEPQVPAVRPDQGHPTRRLALGFGREDDSNYFSFALRPAYNDLLDPPAGYTEGAQINFLDLGLRHAIDENRTRVERVALIDVLSLSPRDPFFKPVSWRIGTGFERRHSADGRALVWRSHAGGGLAWGRWESALFYALLEGTVDVSGRLDKGYSIGVGPHAGLFLRPHPQWKLRLYARGQDYRLGEEYREREYALEQSLSFGVRHALRLTLGERRDDGRSSRFAALAWHGYF